MKRWVWLVGGLGLMAAWCLVCLACLGGSLFGFPRPLQDYLDRRSMRQHFDLPAGLRLLEYEGYPAMVGLGQREGLNLRAVYQLPAHQAEDFEREAAEKGWSPLPVQAATRAKIRFWVAPDTLALDSGWYLCRTAGNDVLRARETRPCAAVDWPNDVIFGAYDAGTRRLHLQIGSGY